MWDYWAFFFPISCLSVFWDSIEIYSEALVEANFKLWGEGLFGPLANLSAFWDTVEISSEALVEAKLRLWGLFHFSLMAYLSVFWDTFEISSEALEEANLKLLEPFSFWSLGKFEHILRHYWDFIWSSRGENLRLLKNLRSWEKVSVCSPFNLIAG